MMVMANSFTTVGDDGHERNSLVQEVICRLQGVLSGVFGDLYDPFGLPRLAQHNKTIFAPASAKRVQLSRFGMSFFVGGDNQFRIE